MMAAQEFAELTAELRGSRAGADPSQLRSINLTVAVPVYNEESNLPELYRRLKNVLSDIPGRHQVLFVNDGSTDGTADLLSAMVLCDPSVKALHFARNFGHQAALSAALDHAGGDAVVLMDGDLQDTPETIPRFVAEHQRGFDVVYAIRTKRKEGWLLRTAYATFYWLISRMSDVDLPQGAGDFSLMSSRVLKIVRSCPERHRYLRGLRRWAGFRQTGIEVERDARYRGESKYSWLKLFRLAADGIFSFSAVPLRAASWMGSLTVGAATVFAVYATVAHLFFSRSPQGFTALIIAITFLAGVQLIFLGVIGEYIGRIYEQVKQRPLYLVDRIDSSEHSNIQHSPTMGRHSNAERVRTAVSGPVSAALVVAGAGASHSG
ncbi:MAG: glycosyltransferase family 2 protein [Planctomyces sp.]|jgi:glycosyltransferase involved in cell wall biosynthesis